MQWVDDELEEIAEEKKVVQRGCQRCRLNNALRRNSVLCKMMSCRCCCEQCLSVRCAG